MKTARGRIHAFLAGCGGGDSGRRVFDILTFDDARIEGVHDFIQWCFSLPEASGAVPGSPVPGTVEAQAIRAGADALPAFAAALTRMRRFYADTDFWLRPHDHNHLRITRILRAVRSLRATQDASAPSRSRAMRRQAARSAARASRSGTKLSNILTCRQG